MKNPITLNCEVCQTTFDVSPSRVARRKTCSVPCRLQRAKKFDPSIEELFVFVWNYSILSLSEHWDVSDKAIEKRCKRLGVQKPPRGYWALIYAGVTREQALLRIGWHKNEIEDLEIKLAQVAL
jgi:hypothetical protein